MKNQRKGTQHRKFPAWLSERVFAYFFFFCILCWLYLVTLGFFLLTWLTFLFANFRFSFACCLTWLECRKIHGDFFVSTHKIHIQIMHTMIILKMKSRLVCSCIQWLSVAGWWYLSFYCCFRIRFGHWNALKKSDDPSTRPPTVYNGVQKGIKWGALTYY